MRLTRRSAISLTFLIAVLLAAWLLPVVQVSGEVNYHSPDVPRKVVSTPALNLFSLNVAHGRGTALNQLLVSARGHRQNLDQIAEILLSSGADVVALQEADAPSLWSGDFDHVAYLAQATDYKVFVHGYHAKAWPFTYGAAMMSRFELHKGHSHQFMPSWPTAGKGFVRGELMWRDASSGAEGRPVTLVSVHLDFSRESVRQAQIQELIEDLAPLETPLIIMGDFNADWSKPDSPTRVLARELGLRAFDPIAAGYGTYKGTQRLDWILISDELTFVEYEVLPDMVSDHLALKAKISWQTGE